MRGVEDDLAERRARRRPHGLARRTRRPSSSSTYAPSRRHRRVDAGDATWPPASVRRQRPRSRRPRKRVAAARVGSRRRRPPTRSSRSHSARFAGAPTVEPRPPAARTRAAGPAVTHATTVASGSTPGTTSPVRIAANAVSSPVTPNGAASNGCSFSSGVVRRVVGRDAVDETVAEGRDERRAVLLRGERRVHLGVGVERAHGLVA